MMHKANVENISILTMVVNRDKTQAWWIDMREYLDNDLKFLERNVGKQGVVDFVSKTWFEHFSQESHDVIRISYEKHGT